MVQLLVILLALSKSMIQGRVRFVMGFCVRFTRVVEELIYNSLDAGATKVFVALVVGTGYIKVKRH